MSLFRLPLARRPSAVRAGHEPPLLVRADDRAARAVRAIDESFAAAPADEARAWARFEPRLDRRAGGAGARSWLRAAGVVAAASVVGAIAFVVWPGRGALNGRREPLPSVPPAVATAPSAPSPATIAGEAPSGQTLETASPPGDRPDATTLAIGTSVLSSGVRARLSRGGRAIYFPVTSVPGYLLLETGTLELESRAVAPHDARAADRALEVRVAGWQVRGGGRFKVATHGRRVDVAVQQGEVTVWSSVRMIARVVAGERWTSAPAAMPASPSDPAGEQRDCLRLARDGVTGEAVACLESQSADPGLTGEIALLELARIRRDVKGDLAGAERLLAEHERRFPKSGLASEARSGRIELLLRLGQPAEALADAQRLGGHEALYWRAVSLMALGRRDEARDAFDAYLRRPDIQRRREATRELDELKP